jgi:hypothetical protein
MGKKVVVEVLGKDYDGVSTQDFYPSYDGAPGRKQKCWSHLIVAARELVEKKQPPPESLEFYEGISQIFEDAKAVEKTLKNSKDMEKEGKLKRVMNVRTCPIIQKCQKKKRFFRTQN